MTELNNFQFWCPCEFTKAIDEATGEEIMRLGGIASTADEDSDGEYLDPKGFDIKPLLKSGMVNWHHQAKTSPATIVGEPHKAEIRKEGLYIETDLYPSSQIARDIWDLAKTLDHDSKTRRLGYSIEGRVLKRKSDDKNSPDYKKITKAIITGVAITHMPKNPKTFANIIKGDIENDFEDNNEEDNSEEKKETKNLDTTKGRALIKEDVDKKIKVVTFSKSEIMDCLFKDIPGIDIEKAEDIYLLISKISNMAKKKKIDEEDIQKAYEALGIPSDIEKAQKTAEGASEQEEETEDGDEKEEKHLKKAKASKAKVVEPKKDDDEDEEDDDEENDPDEKEPDNDEDDVVEESKKEVKKGNENKLFARFDRLEEISVRSHTANTRLVKALGVMVKDLSQKLEKSDTRNAELCDKMDDLLDINKGQEDTINMLSEKLEEYGSASPMPKSIRHSAPVERQFAKANDNELEKAEGSDNGTAGKVSIKNTTAISEILDQATFAKGYDQDFSKACTHFEATKDLPANIISRIKNEFGIEIVK